MKANLDKYDALIDGTSPALEMAKERINNRKQMKYYYLYLPTANLFAHSELQDVRDDYFLIGQCLSESNAEELVYRYCDDYCNKNDWAIEFMTGESCDENRVAFNYAKDYKQLLAEQILLRKKLQEQFRNEHREII